MIKLPDVIGMVLCDCLDFATFPGKPTLMGIFHALRFLHYPAPPRQFTAYCGLYDGVGDGTMELTMTHVQTGIDIHRLQKWYSFPRRLYHVNMEMNVHDCVFPFPGQYVIVLRFDGQELTHRYLDLYQE